MDRIPVILAFTPNYFVPVAATMSSILRNCSKSVEFICLTATEIPGRQKEELEILSGGRAEFHYVSVGELPSDLPVNLRYSAAGIYRLMLPGILHRYRKVIYMDCDIIVRNDIADLYDNVELGDNLIAAVYEAPIGGQAANWMSLGLDPDKYFNSGVLVMNLERMRLECTTDKLLDCIRERQLEFPDQDALNIVCRGRVVPLPPYWNSIRTFLLPQYRNDFLKRYTQDDLDEVTSHGNIHYTGGKPWNIYSQAFGLWWQEYRSLPELIRREWTPSGKIRILSELYSIPAIASIAEYSRRRYREIKYRLGSEAIVSDHNIAGNLSKHAFLILAHEDFQVLRDLVSDLDDVRNDIYIHFDADLEQLPDIHTEHAGLSVLGRRIDVRWGDVSVVEAEYELFEAAVANGPYGYYHLLSGTDRALKTQDYIHSFFAIHQGREFIGYTLTSINPEIERKAMRWHLFPGSFRNAGLVKRAIRSAFLRLQELCGIRRNAGVDFKKGSQWVSITDGMARYFIENKKWALKTFSHSFCSDEMVMQTLCWNSPFRDFLYNTDDDAAGCMRAISWKGSMMSYWTDEDLGRLRKSDALFARKFRSAK